MNMSAPSVVACSPETYCIPSFLKMTKFCGKVSLYLKAAAVVTQCEGKQR